MEAHQTKEDFKQIEDIIDARKEQGYYNVYKNETSRFATSNAVGNMDRYVRFEDSISQNDSVSNLKLTDSEVTITKVRCGGTAFKRCQSKWDMQDIAIPGDGSHLGESPSLVNLATMVIQFPVNVSSAEGCEYLVPLSSWDPYYKLEEYNRKPEVTDSESTNESLEKNLRSSESSNSRISSQRTRRLAFAEKITRFIKKRCRRSKDI